jgi:outer membrane lipoprotein-sorting protein
VTQYLLLRAFHPGAWRVGVPITVEIGVRGCRAWTVLLLAFAGFLRAAAADPPSHTQDWGLPQLMSTMHSVRSATAHFVERKFVHLLNQPLQSSGTLTFVAPDRLQKQTLAPAPSRLTVVGDRLEVEQPDGKLRNLSLSEVPEIVALVASIRATLAGDGVTLTRYYTSTLTGSAADWSLLLEPRDPRLRDLLTMIRIRGEGSMIRGIETMERDGDRTEMTIVPDPR